MKIFSDKQLTIKDIWLLSLRLFCKALPHVWPVATFLGIARLMSVLLKYVGTSTSYNAVYYLSAQLVIMLLETYFGGIILYRTCMVGNEKNVTLNDSFIFVGKKYFQLFISMLFIVFVCLLGALAFVIPGVFLFILFIMVPPLILFDNKGWYEVFKDNCRLIWGNWWRTFAAIFPPLFFIYLVAISIHFFPKSSYWWPVLVIAILIILTLVYVLYYSCILVQFNDLKIRQQKHGI